MPVAAIVGAVGSAAVGAKAAGKARKAQERSANQQIALQQSQDAEARRQFELQREDLAPFRAAGTGALGQLVAGTQDGAEFNRNFTNADFVKEPGYDFRQREGQRGVEASASARGGILSGGALKALARYNQEYASNEFGNAYNRFNNDRNTRFGRLANLAGIGQSATSEGNQASSNLTNNLQQGVNNRSQALGDIGNARASQYVATGNAFGNALANIGQFAGAGGFSRGGIGGGGSSGAQPGTLGGLAQYGGTPGVNPNAPAGIQRPRFYGGYSPYGT